MTDLQLHLALAADFIAYVTFVVAYAHRVSREHRLERLGWELRLPRKHAGQPWSGDAEPYTLAEIQQLERRARRKKRSQKRLREA